MKSIIYNIILSLCITTICQAQNTGNVGIGTENPQAKLHVAGDIKIDSLKGAGERNVTVGPDGRLQAGPFSMDTSSTNGNSLDAADGDPVNVVFVDDDGKVHIGNRNSETGEAAHMLDPDGSVRHTGTGIFESGLKVEAVDTGIVVRSVNGIGVYAISGDFSENQQIKNGTEVKKNNNHSAILGASNIVVAIVGTSRDNDGVQGNSDSSNGVRGLSETGTGVHGGSENGAGVNGFSINSTGVNGGSAEGTGGEFHSINGTGIEVEGDPAGKFKGAVEVQGEIFAKGINIVECNEDGSLNKEAPVFSVDENGTVVIKDDLSIKGLKVVKCDEEGNPTDEVVVSLTSEGGENKASFCEGLKAHLGLDGSSPGVVDIPSYNGKINNIKSSTGNAVSRGNVGEFFNFFTDNEDPAVVISTAGIGESLVSQVTNVENTRPAIVAFHEGIGPAIVGFTSGSGRAAEFVSNNADNDQAALVVFHTGAGRAAQFSATNETNNNAALIAFHSGSGSAVLGVALGTGLAGQFEGDVLVTGTITEQGSGFKIDHPLDPLSKTLHHSTIASPDMMNVYNGNITTDEEGLAKVELPDYFEVLNEDFRYQLTVIGTFAQAIVAKKVQANAFYIRTNEPTVEVSWQVTGIRKDDYAQHRRIEVEADKEEEMMGKLLFDPSNPKSHLGKYQVKEQGLAELNDQW